MRQGVLNFPFYHHIEKTADHKITDVMKLMEPIISPDDNIKLR